MADEINQSEHVKVLKLNAVVLTLAVFLNHQEKKFQITEAEASSWDDEVWH